MGNETFYWDGLIDSQLKTIKNPYFFDHNKFCFKHIYSNLLTFTFLCSRKNANFMFDRNSDFTLISLKNI